MTTKPSDKDLERMADEYATMICIREIAGVEAERVPIVDPDKRDVFIAGYRAASPDLAIIEAQLKIATEALEYITRKGDEYGWGRKFSDVARAALVKIKGKK